MFCNFFGNSLYEFIRTRPHVIEREYVRRKRFVEAQEQVKHVRIGETQIHKKCKVYKARGQIKAMGT